MDRPTNTFFFQGGNAGYPHQDNTNTTPTITHNVTFVDIKITQAFEGFPMGIITCLPGTPCTDINLLGIDTSALGNLTVRPLNCSHASGTASGNVGPGGVGACLGKPPPPGAGESDAASPPPLATAFETTQTNSCGGGFPMCPSKNQTRAVYSQYVAQDLARQLERVGPTDLLPLDRNQVIVTNFAKGFQYGLHVDASVEPAKVINCSRLAVPTQTAAQLEQSFAAELGFATREAASVSTPEIRF